MWKRSEERSGFPLKVPSIATCFSSGIWSFSWPCFDWEGICRLGPTPVTYPGFESIPEYFLSLSWFWVIVLFNVIRLFCLFRILSLYIRSSIRYIHLKLVRIIWWKGCLQKPIWVLGFQRLRWNKDSFFNTFFFLLPLRFFFSLWILLLSLFLRIIRLAIFRLPILGFAE